MPTISILIPVYKVEHYIHRCIDSILGQTYPHFDLILVDDGSPDNCGAICDEYARKDSRIHVIHQENGGLSAARNAGIDWVFSNSDSQWLTFVDSDDWVHPEFLERLLYAASETGTDISVCGFVETTGETPAVQLNTRKPELWTPERLYTERNVNAIIAWGKLYKRQLFSHIRFPNGKIHEDELTTYKLLFPQEKVAVLSAPMYFYFQNAEGISKSRWNPKRMDAVQGLWEQAQYFQGNGFNEALDFAAASYVELICRQKKAVRDSELTAREKRKYISLLNRALWGMLWDFRQVYTAIRNLYILCIAFPVLKPFYTVARAIYQPIKKRRCGNTGENTL